MAAAIRLSQQHSCSFDHLVGAQRHACRHFITPPARRGRLAAPLGCHRVGRLVLRTDLNRSESRFERFGPAVFRMQNSPANDAAARWLRHFGPGYARLGLSRPHAVSWVRFTSRSGHARACREMLVQPLVRSFAPDRPNAGSRTSCSCSLPASDKLATSAGSRLARRRVRRMTPGAWRGGNP